MSLRVHLPEKQVSEIEKVIVKNLGRILINSKSVGVRTVPNWESNLSEKALSSVGDLAVSKDDNLISFERLGVHRKLINCVSEALPEYKVTPSGFFHYPPTGYMGWHTNSDVPCKRLYITWVVKLSQTTTTGASRLGCLT